MEGVVATPEATGTDRTQVAMEDGPPPPRPGGGLAPLRPLGGGVLAPIRAPPPRSGGLAPVSAGRLPSLPDSGPGPLGPPRGPGGRPFNGRSLNPSTAPLSAPLPPVSSGARMDAPSPSPSPAPSPALVFMRPQVDPHEAASLLSDVTNMGGSGRSKPPTQSVAQKDIVATTSRPIVTTSSVASSPFDAGTSARAVDGRVRGSGLAPRGQASWDGTSRETAQQVAAAVVNADQRRAAAGQQERPRPDTRKSISGGKQPDRKMHKENRMKLVVVPMPGRVQPGSVAPPTDCQVIDERTWLTDRIVQFPCCSLAAMLLIPLVMALVAGLKAPFEIDISLSSFEIRSSHFSQQRYLATQEAVDAENEHYTSRRQLWTPPSQRLGRLEMIYAPRQAIELADRPEKVAAVADGEQYDGIEMLRLDRLDYVRRIERAVQNFAGYEDYCRKDSDSATGVCSPPSSLITYLYPTRKGDCDFVYDGRGNQLVRPISETMSALAAMSETSAKYAEQYHWFFSTKDVEQLSRPHPERQSTLIRSSFTFALDRRPTQGEREAFEAWLADLIDALEKERIKNPDTNGVTYLVGGLIPTRILWLRALRSDMLLAFSSFLLVLLYTWFHTGSLLLAVMSMLMIALSFPVSIFFYYMFFGNAKLGVLNVLSIYIVLGIGVDDCYVFLDAFQQSRHAPTLEQAFGAALTRSARAMFVTSFTTAMAFLANMISSIPVIFSFAVFMATLVVVNYVFTITIYAGILNIWVQHFEKREKAFYSGLRHNFACLDKLCQCCNSSAEEMTELPQELRSKPASSQVAEIEGSHPAPDIDDFATRLEDVFVEQAAMDAETAPANAQSTWNSHSTDHEKIVEELRKQNIHIRSLRNTERWFLFRFGPFLTRNRKNIIGFVTTLVLLSAIMAARLTPSRDVPQLFPSEHPVQLHQDFKSANFTAGSCDECAATFKPEFMCHDVYCGGGNICLFGQCYHSWQDYRQDEKMPPEEIPYGFQKPYKAIQRDFESISAAVAYHCNAEPGTLGRAAMANVAGGTTLTRNQAQRILEHYMGVYVPDGESYAAGCDDDYRECFAWSERGECDDNPGFMRSNCRFSCGLCDAGIERYHQCHDNLDNDRNDGIDCADRDCFVSPGCRDRAALSDADRNAVFEQALLMDSCREFLADFLEDCTMEEQRTTLKNALTQACPLGSDCRVFVDRMGTGPLPQRVTGRCDYTPPEGHLDGTSFDKATHTETAKCICDESEMSFYLGTGLTSLAFASFNIYAAYQAMNRRSDFFEHKLSMATALMFYVYGVVPCCFWLSCFPGPNESKENGFFGMMLFCALSCALGILVLRKRWDSDFEEKPDLGANYVCFCGFCTVALIAFCIFGLAKTSANSTDGYDAVEHSHVLSSCNDLSNLNSSIADEFADGTSDGDGLCDRPDAPAGCEDAIIQLAAGDCRDQCGAPERMLYSVGAFVMITGSLGCIGLMRLDGTEKMQPTWNGATLAPFFVHGCLAGVFWFRCVSLDSSQEHTFFIAQLVWTLIAAAGQGILAAHKRLLKDFGFHLLMCPVTLMLIFISIGVHVTVTQDLMFFQTCRPVELTSVLVSEAQPTSAQDKVDNNGDAYDPSAVWGERECVIDDQCGYVEKTTYGFLALLLSATSCVVFCLRGCRITVDDFPKSINNVTIGLWGLLTLVIMSFWIGCGATDSTVEKPFWVTLLVSSVILSVALFCYGVSLVDVEPKGFDAAMKMQVGASLAVVAVSAMLVHITVSNGENFLAECQVYERCHWWQVGMTPAVDCSEYWDRLRFASHDDCANTRCNGHGLCVGFRLTGGCKCTPSFTGRYCDEHIPVNTNKALVDIVFGLDGILEDTDIISIDGEEEPVGTPVYWGGEFFDVSTVAAQQHIADMCDSLAALDDVLQVQSMMCFMTDFRGWVQSGCPRAPEDEVCPCTGGVCSFPVPRDSFLNAGATGGLLKSWLKLDGGKYFRHIGFERHPTQGHSIRVNFARISVYTKLSTQEPGFSALSTFNRLENFVASWNERAEAGQVAGLASSPAYQTSKLWIKMFTEVSAVNGIVYAIVIIAFCSFFTIFVFTGHVRMATIVVMNVFAMLCTILGYFKAAGWSLGIVEAVSALVLLGSSVDYSLHVAEAFVDCSQHNAVSVSPMGRSALVTQALTKIGVSVLHAAGTTFLSVFCLLFCTVTLFVKFGQIIMASVLVSIAFALMPLPSALGLLGPKRFRRSFKRQMFMLLSLSVSGLLVLMVVYSLDKSGQIDVVGPAGEPLFGRKVRVANGAFGDEV